VYVFKRGVVKCKIRTEAAYRSHSWRYYLRPTYNIGEIIGTGSFGEVRLCTVNDTGRQVALKFLHNISEDTLRRFNREGRILYENLDNKFVVDLLDYNLNVSPPFLVLEYCKHGSLAGWVTQRRSWETVALALSHATQGLAGIHHVRGFHRDIKPDNLLLTTDQEDKLIVKLSDFGLARTPFSVTGSMTASPAGTEGYIAPEIRAGGRFTPAADIYSLGITGIELLTGSKASDQLLFCGAPQSFRSNLQLMAATDPLRRPNIQHISQSLVELLENANLETIGADMVRRKGISPGWVLGGLALLALLAGGKDNEWDRSVRRYRGPDGRFTS